MRLVSAATRDMPAILFASISPSAGKSAIAAAVAAHFAGLGRRVTTSSSLKPVLDAQEGGIRFTDDSEPKVARGSLGVILGGTDTASSDVANAESLDAHVILVVRLGEQVVEEASKYGSRLAGVVWNKVPRYRTQDLKDACGELADAGIRCLGYIPEDRGMAANGVADIMSHLGAETIMPPRNGDSLIETFLIGGLVLDWGPTYFDSEPATCVVVRTGRPDVQISALQSESTRAVLMTGGGKPIDYVFYEARTKGIPLFVTERDTNDVMSRLDDIAPSSVAHPGKLERMRELLAAGDVMSNVMELAAAPATR